MAGSICTIAVEAELSAGVWTDITEHTIAEDGLRIAYGVQGNSPIDCVASTGECAFTLKNDASTGAQGTYSPLHANARSGWTLGTGLRVRFTHDAVTYTKHRGKVRIIDPDPGAFGRQRVSVTSYDVMRDLAETELRGLTLQVGQSEDDLVTAILDACPTAAQPIARSLDAGVDTFPYAFHDVGPGLLASTLLQDVAESSFALIACKGDGTLILKSRQSRALGSSSFTFTNTMHGLRAPADVDNLYNRIRVTIRPTTIDAAATTVLYAQPVGTSPVVQPGETIEVWVEYRDPNESQTLVGGLDVVDPLVSGTDYVGNAAADGSGANLTASLSVVITPFASTALIEITNNHATSPVYVTTLQVRGKGVYDRGPQTYEASSEEDYGNRPLNIELRYQADASIAQSYATYLLQQYSTLSAQGIGVLEFLANDSDDFMEQAFAREPGDLITITETMTGLSAVEAVIHSVELDVSPGPWVVCRWGLAPAAPFKAWLLGITGRSELGTTTRLGF